jgi:hypothetical protein
MLFCLSFVAVSNTECMQFRNTRARHPFVDFHLRKTPLNEKTKSMEMKDNESAVVLNGRKRDPGLSFEY